MLKYFTFILSIINTTNKMIKSDFFVEDKQLLKPIIVCDTNNIQFSFFFASTYTDLFGRNEKRKVYDLVKHKCKCNLCSRRIRKTFAMYDLNGPFWFKCPTYPELDKYMKDLHGKIKFVETKLIPVVAEDIFDPRNDDDEREHMHRPMNPAYVSTASKEIIDVIVKEYNPYEFDKFVKKICDIQSHLIDDHSSEMEFCINLLDEIRGSYSNFNAISISKKIRIVLKYMIMMIKKNISFSLFLKQTENYIQSYVKIKLQSDFTSLLKKMASFNVDIPKETELYFTVLIESDRDGTAVSIEPHSTWTNSVANRKNDQEWIGKYGKRKRYLVGRSFNGIYKINVDT